MLQFHWTLKPKTLFNAGLKKKKKRLLLGNLMSTESNSQAPTVAIVSHLVKESRKTGRFISQQITALYFGVSVTAGTIRVCGLSVAFRNAPKEIDSSLIGKFKLIRQPNFFLKNKIEIEIWWRKCPRMSRVWAPWVPFYFSDSFRSNLSAERVPVWTPSNVDPGPYISIKY